MVEFGDLQCPVCQAFSAQIAPGLISDVVRKGTAKYEFRQYTIIGPDSTAAAKAALAAGEQGRYWNFIELFYRNQGTENSGYVTDELPRVDRQGRRASPTSRSGTRTATARSGMRSWRRSSGRPRRSASTRHRRSWSKGPAAARWSAPACFPERDPQRYRLSRSGTGCRPRAAYARRPRSLRRRCVLTARARGTVRNSPAGRTRRIEGMSTRRLTAAIATALLALGMGSCGGDDDSDGGGDGGTSGGELSGKIAVLLPDSKSSDRWEKADRRFFERGVQGGRPVGGRLHHQQRRGRPRDAAQPGRAGDHRRARRSSCSSTSIRAAARRSSPTPSRRA